MLSKMQSAMPDQVFAGVLEEGVRPALQPHEFEAAAAAIGFRLAA
jgi:hypothetical protein